MFIFFFNDTATTEIYTLSLHDALPISRGFSYATDAPLDMRMDPTAPRTAADVVNTYSRGELTRVLKVYGEERFRSEDTRLNSSHANISYAVFCLKKKT